VSWSSGHRVKSLPWAPSRVERLRALWAKGKTASEIAADLGGISRNGVIGKAHRLGLPARPSPIQRRR
jgi:GcrA cell cycle regulator